MFRFDFIIPSLEELPLSIQFITIIKLSIAQFGHRRWGWFTQTTYGVDFTDPTKII
jgi:hypothetical protein